MKPSRTLLTAALALSASLSQAAPVTLEFTATIAENYVYALGASDNSKIGQLVTGRITFDLDNAEGTWGTGVPTDPYHMAGKYSESGCPYVYNGVCQQDQGGGASIVVTYQLTATFGVFGPMSDLEASNSYASDFQANGVRSSYVGGNQRTYHYDHSQEGWSNTVRERGIEIGSSTAASTADLFANILMPTRLVFWNYDLRQSCAYTPSSSSTCHSQYDPASIYIRADITRVTVIDDAVVPEPETLALLGLGLLGMPASRLLRKRSAAV